MPYRWSHSTSRNAAETLQLWPHQSLTPDGFVVFIGATACMLAVPLLVVLGSVVMWFLLPFMMMAVGGVWFAIHRNRRSAQILEVLTLTGDQAHLVRHDPQGDPQEWECNRYWATAALHKNDGPVPHYVTLKGGGREVEIGAFLSEEERLALFDDLSRALRR